MLETYNFRRISAKFLPKTKSSITVETCFRMGSFAVHEV